MPSFSARRRGHADFTLLFGCSTDGAAADGDVVQWVLTPEEIKTLKTLASGIGDDEWVSEQDAISSYWINLLNLGGDDVRSVINSVNVRSSPTRETHPR